MVELCACRERTIGENTSVKDTTAAAAAAPRRESLVGYNEAIS